MAEAIAAIAGDSERLAAMSKANFEKAKEYRPEVMNARKAAFWDCIKQRCSEKITKC